MLQMTFRSVTIVSVDNRRTLALRRGQCLTLVEKPATDLYSLLAATTVSFYVTQVWFLFFHMLYCYQFRKTTVIVKKSNLRFQWKHLFWAPLSSKECFLQNSICMLICTQVLERILRDRFLPSSQQTSLDIREEFFNKAFKIYLFF